MSIDGQIVEGVFNNTASAALVDRIMEVMATGRTDLLSATEWQILKDEGLVGPSGYKPKRFVNVIPADRFTYVKAPPAPRNKDRDYLKVAKATAKRERRYRKQVFDLFARAMGKAFGTCKVYQSQGGK